MDCDRRTLFTAREGGYLHHHVPGIVRTRGGVVVVSVEARYDSRGGRPERSPDYRDHDVLLRRSPDDGATWLPEQVVLSRDAFGPGPLHNFTMVGDLRGRLHALVLHDYRRLFHVWSDDDGASWSPPVDHTGLLHQFDAVYPWKAFGTGCGHGIASRSGRLIVPVWMSDNSHSVHRPSIAATVFSDDAGESWQAGEIVCLTTPSFRWPSEGMVVELPDGHILINLRSESDAKRRLLASSPDGVSRWSEPWFAADLADPVCEGAMIALPDPCDPTRTLLAFTNPDSLERLLPGVGGNKSDRKNMTLKLSTDLGRSWPISHVIEPGPANYSDLCALPDGTVLVVFNCGMASPNMHDSAMTVVQRIAVSPLVRASASGETETTAV